MKSALKLLLTICMVPITLFSAIFTVIWTVGTLLTWNTTDTGSKLMTVVFVIGFFFLLGITSMLFEQLPSSNSKKKRTGIEYEEYCGAYLLKHGFHDVMLTPASGDYGADIVAKDEYNNTWVFQCKNYASKVGNGCVQEVVAAKNHYHASKAAVITNSNLTDKAKELAFENEVILFECID